jgi:hypothetical protein
MRVCIHRGTQQIGGTCVEIEASPVLDCLVAAHLAMTNYNIPNTCGSQSEMAGM